MQIRDAVQADFEQITAIYNDVLTNSTAIYNDRPASISDRIAWWRARVEQNFPVLVAADGEHICGFGSYGDFRSWPGYRFTVEGTLHVASEIRGQGVGSLLLKTLIMQAKQAGKHSMIAGVLLRKYCIAPLPRALRLRTCGPSARSRLQIQSLP